MRRVAVRAPRAEAEIARARLLTLVREGFEEVEHRDELELAAYTDAEGEARIRAAFGDVAVSDVPADWRERWREFHRPVEIAGIWIGPPWIDAPDGALTVSIDPGQAFGTGAHATTRACVELLARTGRGSLLDAGCGSGVLAVAGARLGFAPVHAVDVDEAAVEATRRNAALNGVEVAVSQLDVRQGDLPPADVLVANIELRVVEALLARWPGRRAILSGYLAEERPRVAGWRSGARAERDGWAADSLARTTV